MGWIVALYGIPGNQEPSSHTQHLTHTHQEPGTGNQEPFPFILEGPSMGRDNAP